MADLAAVKAPALEDVELAGEKTVAGAALSAGDRYVDDGGLTWDASREVWVGSDGFAHDGSRLYGYSGAGSP